MSGAPILFELNEAPGTFHRLVQDLPAESAYDQRHWLQLSDSWRLYLDEDVLSQFDTLDNISWQNLERLLRRWKLSPMPLLHAICRLSDQVSEALQRAEAWRRNAPLADMNRHYRFMEGVVRLLRNMRCDPLALTPPLRRKLGLSDSSFPSAVIAALERAVSGSFVNQCSVLETRTVLNAIHWLRSLEYCTRMSLRQHQGCGAIWCDAFLQLLKTAHMQLCTAEHSPAVTIDLPQARRKAENRYGLTRLGAAREKYEALCAKQYDNALRKGNEWALQVQPLRESEFEELRRRTALTLLHRVDPNTLSMADNAWYNHHKQDEAMRSRLQLLKRPRCEQRYSGLSMADRLVTQIALEKSQWQWPLLDDEDAERASKRSKLSHHA